MQNTSEAWFAAVQNITAHWRRVNDRCIVLWLPGFKTVDCLEAESIITALGGTVLSVEFDSDTEKTRILVREPKDFVPFSHSI